MPRRPVVLQLGVYGSSNPNSNPNIPAPPPTIAPNNVVIKKEQFLGRPGLDSNTARALDQLQTNIIQGTGPTLNSPMANHQVINNVTLMAGHVNVVPHGMGVPYKYVKVMNFNTFCQYKVIPNTTPSSQDQIQVQIGVTSNCTATVVVYA